MTWVDNIFEWAVVYYRELMADYMHFHFVMRTAFFMLILGLTVVIGKYALEYIVGPIIIFILFQVLFRAWNFFITETRQEWIYIHFYSKNDSRYNQKYLSLCDKINDNRQKMARMSYIEVFKRKNLRKLSRGLFVFIFVVVALWLCAFGIYANNDLSPAIVETDFEISYTISEELPHDINLKLDWLQNENIILRLNSRGIIGSRLRNAPNFEDSYVIEILWGEQRMTYTGVFHEDDYDTNMYWLQVIAPSGQIGYISSQLVEEDI